MQRICQSVTISIWARPSSCPRPGRPGPGPGYPTSPNEFLTNDYWSTQQNCALISELLYTDRYSHRLADRHIIKLVWIFCSDSTRLSKLGWVEGIPQMGSSRKEVGLSRHSGQHKFWWALQQEARPVESARHGHAITIQPDRVDGKFFDDEQNAVRKQGRPPVAHRLTQLNCL